MQEIICKSQAELDAVPTDFGGRVIIKFGTHSNPAVINRRFTYSVEARGTSSVVAWGTSSVVARGNSSVEAWGKSTVEAWDNSSVVAWDTSSVVAWGTSSVVARGNSSVEAWGKSTVEARGTSSVVAWDTSSVVARGNSSVEAWGKSTVVAWDTSSVMARGTSSVCRRSKYADIAATGNSREVCPPRTITEYSEFYGLPIDNELKTIKLYKAVHRQSGESYFVSDWDSAFKYVIGETITPSDFDADATQLCGPGINLAHKAWAVDYGQYWRDLAILECECKCDEVLVPEYTNGKVRAKRAKVLREVPLEECGLLGKMIAKRMAKNEA